MMSAKFLSGVFGDDNAGNMELQKRHQQQQMIGCMPGIFQMFDRHYLLAGRRHLVGGGQPKRLLSGGHPVERISSSGQISAAARSPQIIVLEKNFSKSWNENHQRTSLESSRTSVSSSSGSSFSSLDCNRSLAPMQDDMVPSADQMSLPYRPLINTSNPKTSGHERQHDQTEPLATERTASADIRDVVKDSIYRDRSRRAARAEKDHDQVLSKLRELTLDPAANLPTRLSYDVRDPFARLPAKEGPRLSYDGRPEHGSLPRLQEAPRRLTDGNSAEPATENDQKPSYNRPSAVVAKLMGLDSLPRMQPPAQGPTAAPALDTAGPAVMRRSAARPNQQIETAPWRKLDRVQEQRRVTGEPLQRRQRQPPSSAHGEIEKKVMEFEFQESNKDLRALIQIIDSMQAKGLLKRKEEERNLPKRSDARKHGIETRSIQNKNVPISSKDSNLRSPIVIMKPAKFVDRAIGPGSGSAVVPLEVMIPVVANERRKGLTATAIGKPATKDQNQKSTPQTLDEQVGSSMNSATSVSPRLQQRKIDQNRVKPRPPVAPKADSVPQRNQVKKRPASQGDRRPRRLSIGGDELSTRSESHVSNGATLDVAEGTSLDKLSEMRSSSFPQHDNNQAPCSPKQKSLDEMSEDLSTLERASTATEQPSPVSVLDSSFEQEDIDRTISKKIHRLSRVDHESQTEGRQKSSTGSTATEGNHLKLKNVETLLQKLQQLSSPSAATDLQTDHIAFLCDTSPSPDNRYISEILLASGLLMKDLNTDQPTHESGYPINPDLFAVLEQRKSSVDDGDQKRRRKLVFDTVNEVLKNKLKVAGSNLRRLAEIETGQQMVRRVCTDIEELMAAGGHCAVTGDETIVHTMDGWSGGTNSSEEAMAIVLDIERHVFKQLVDEVVSGEVAVAAARLHLPRRRQLVL